MVQVVVGAATVHDRPPGLAVASYDNTAEPPSLDGAVQVTTTEPSAAPGTADTLRGGVGAVFTTVGAKLTSIDKVPRVDPKLV